MQFSFFFLNIFILTTKEVNSQRISYLTYVDTVWYTTSSCVRRESLTVD